MRGRKDALYRHAGADKCFVGFNNKIGHRSGFCENEGTKIGCRRFDYSSFSSMPFCLFPYQVPFISGMVFY